MKLFKKLRKGFTLIELVVVIAVIAILSAVSVVSYVAITNKAKQSSDEQAVRQMNTILQANDVMDLRSIKDVFAAFAENGLDGKDYKPLMKDTYFFWDQDANRIIYVNKDYVVIYPESMKGQTKKADSHWLSLSGEIVKRDYSSEVTATGGTITGTATEAGEKLYKLSEDIKSGSYKVNTADAQTITLPANVDLAGSEFNLGKANNVTLQGASETNKTTIDNVFTSEYQAKGSSNNRKDRSYSAGMVQEVVGGTVTFKNLVIKNVTIGDYGISLTGIFAGAVRSGGKLVVENCEIEDAYIYGEQKVAAVVGYINGGTVEVKNCTFKNVHVLAEEGCAGGLTGYADKSFTIDCDDNSVASIKNNVSTEITKVSNRKYLTVGSALEDASNEVVLALNPTTKEAEQKDGKDRYKPGCAVFGWKAGTKLVGSNYCIDYGLAPLHSTDL